MKEKRYYWLKLSESFFREPEVKKLRKLPGGDIHTIIYQKLMLLSLEHGGQLFFEGIEEDLETELALIIDEDVDYIRMCLMYLDKVRLIQYSPDRTSITMCQVPELIGSETDAARRQRKSRQNRQVQQPYLAQKCDIVTPVSQDVTQIIDIDLDIDIELDDDIIRIIHRYNSNNMPYPAQQDADTADIINNAIQAVGRDTLIRVVDYISDTYHSGGYKGYYPHLKVMLRDHLQETIRKMQNKTKKINGFALTQDYNMDAIERDMLANN